MHMPEVGNLMISDGLYYQSHRSLTLDFWLQLMRTGELEDTRVFIEGYAHGMLHALFFTSHSKYNCQGVVWMDWQSRASAAQSCFPPLCMQSAIMDVK